MKKTILLLTIGLACTTISLAQKSKINEAADALKDAQKSLILKQDESAATLLNKAKDAIDAATTHEATKDNGKAWFTKAAVYMAMQESNQFSSSNPYLEAISALKKAAELDKKTVNEEQFPSLLANGAFYSFNAGVNAMNNGQYASSFQSFNETNLLLGWDNNRFFKDNAQIDSIAARSKLFQGYSTFYDNKYDQAIPLLKAAAENPITASESNIYLLLAQAYEKQGKKQEQLDIIEAGKKKFPDDKNITNAQLNFYLNSGKQSEMIAKLEEAISQDPKNASLPFNLGLVYRDLSALKDDPTPATEENFSKAEASFKKAIELEPSNTDYQFELGALYYNKAGYYNNKMMSLGVDNASLKLAQEMKPLRDDYFNKAIQYLEQARSNYRSQKSSLSPKEKSDYSKCLEALNSIYVNLDRMEESNSVNAELKGL